MYGSTLHWRRLVNGHSGVWPASYLEREKDLARPLDDRERAWRTLLHSGATHVIVHEELFEAGQGGPVSDWLRQSGAHETMRIGPDRLFTMPANERQH